MTTPILCRVSLAATSGIPADGATNDFAFLAADTSSGTLDGITQSIVDLYTLGHTSNALGVYLSSALSRSASACGIDVYDLTGHLDGSPTGSPIYTTAFTLPGVGFSAANQPSEVAVVFAYLADGWETIPETAINPSPPPATLRPRSRYRGRMYLGPLTDKPTDNDANGNPRPTDSTFLADCAAQWFAFMDERGGDFGVWSRADAQIRLVAPGGLVTIDNAYDTQRRRGVAPTARTQLFP